MANMTSSLSARDVQLWTTNPDSVREWAQLLTARKQGLAPVPCRYHQSWCPPQWDVVGTIRKQSAQLAQWAPLLNQTALASPNPPWASGSVRLTLLRTVLTLGPVAPRFSPEPRLGRSLVRSLPHAGASEPVPVHCASIHTRYLTTLVTMDGRMEAGWRLFVASVINPEMRVASVGTVCHPLRHLVHCIPSCGKESLWD